jgi:hypothetical protein
MSTLQRLNDTELDAVSGGFNAAGVLAVIAQVNQSQTRQNQNNGALLSVAAQGGSQSSTTQQVNSI